MDKTHLLDEKSRIEYNTWLEYLLDKITKTKQKEFLVLFTNTDMKKYFKILTSLLAF